MGVEEQKLDATLSVLRDQEPTSKVVATPIADPNPLTNSRCVPISSSERYLIGEEIARGGMGEVFRATDTVLNREVAVKVLQAKFPAETGTARRFHDEARIMGQLQHPGIPPVHDLGVLPDGRPFLAMKLIKGRTLENLLETRPDVDHDRGRFVAVFEQICQAMAYAHAHEVIHRDLKPQNVMVGSFGEVQVMDWGLAKVLTAADQVTESEPEATAPATVVQSLRESDGSFTQAGSVLGTPAYMPPEQAVGAVTKIDTRSDVFGLGAVLAVILTGKPPFASRTGETTRMKAAQGKVQECFNRLDECAADPELIALAKRCLAPDQDERPANAGEVAREVAALRQAADERARQAELDKVKAEGEVAAAALASAERRKRRRVWALLGIAVALLAMFGVAAGWWVDRQATEARRKDEAALAEKAAAEAKAHLERQASEERARQGAAAAIALAAQLRDGYRFVDAQAALHQARTALPDDQPVDAATALETAILDLEMLSKLDEIRINRIKSGWVNEADLPPAYREQFASRGLIARETSPAEAADVIEQSPIREQLLLALDVWAIHEIDERIHRWVADVAARLDPDPWRGRLRVFRLVNDQSAVRKLVADADFAKLRPHHLGLLFQCLVEADSVAEPPLRAAAVRYRDDFWVQLEAGLYFYYKNRRPTDAQSHLRAALALRPDNQFVFNAFASTLFTLNDLEGAVACHKELARLRPNAASTHAYIARIYAARNLNEQAEAAYHDALAADPKFTPAYLGLADLMLRQARHDDAVAAATAAVAVNPADSNALGQALLLFASRPSGRELEGFEQVVAAAAAVTAAEKTTTTAAVVDSTVQLGVRLSALSLLKPLAADIERASAAVVKDRNPRAGAVWLVLGYLQAERQDPAAAESFARVIELEGGRDDSVPALLARFQLGRIYSDAGRVDESIALLEPVVRSGTGLRTSAAYWLAYMYMNAGMLDEAVAAFARLAAEDPTDPVIRHRYADSLRYRCKYTEAIAEYRAAIRLDPKDDSTYYHLGRCFYGLHDLDGCLAAGRKAAEMYQRPGAKSKLNHWESVAAAQPQLDEFVASKAVPASAQQAYNAVELAAIRRRYADGARLYAAALARFPELANHRTTYGCYEAQCAVHAGTGGDTSVTDPAERAEFRRLAREWLRAEMVVWESQLQVIDQRKGISLGRRALLMWKYDPHLAAIRDPAAIAKFPDAERSEWEQFWAEVDTVKDPIGAAQALQDAIQLYPNNASLYDRLGWALQLQDDWEGAEKQYRKTLELDPKHPTAWRGMAKALRKRGDLEGAIAAFREAIRVNPNDFDTLENLAATLVQNQDWPGAVQEYREAGKRNPESVMNQLLKLRSELLMAHNGPQAVEVCRLATEINPTSAVGHLALGYLLETLSGDLDGATAAFKAAERLAPELAAGREGIARVERLRGLLKRLPAILAETDKTAPLTELIELANLCLTPYQGKYMAAFRLFDRVILNAPDLLVAEQRRYNAACAGVLAGSGLGPDAPRTSAELAELRRQALVWFREDVESWKLLNNSGLPAQRAAAASMLAHSLKDPDMARVRPGSERIDMPDDERADWDAVWAEVRQALAQNE